jgi:hypothetical protein
VRAPVDVRGRRDRDAVRAQVAFDESLGSRVVEHLHLERLRVGRDREVGRLAGRVARMRERDVDAEHAHDRRSQRTAGPVHPVRAALAAGDHGRAEDVRPRLEVAGRPPGNHVRAGAE